MSETTNFHRILLDTLVNLTKQLYRASWFLKWRLLCGVRGSDVPNDKFTTVQHYSTSLEFWFSLNHRHC